MEINVLELANWAGAVMALVALGAWLKNVIKKAIKPIKDLNEKIDEQSKSIALLKESMMLTLRNDIITISKSPFKERVISTYDLEVLIDMHKNYKELGGNGYIDNLIKDIKELKVTSKYEKLKDI